MAHPDNMYVCDCEQPRPPRWLTDGVLMTFGSFLGAVWIGVLLLVIGGILLHAVKAAFPLGR